MAERVELAQVIGQLRQELSAAIRDGEGENLRFELGQVELELTVAVSKEAGPNAKVRFWVIELGADGKVASQATQRITLTRRRPCEALGSSLLVCRQRPPCVDAGPCCFDTQRGRQPATCTGEEHSGTGRRA